MKPRILLSLLVVANWMWPLSMSSAGVVINEIFYRAPEDLTNLEYVELWNSGGSPVDISGWKLKGVSLSIPAGTQLESKAYWVACRDLDLFRRIYGFDADAVYGKSLSDGGERLKLEDASGELIETVKYDDKKPWPRSADGYSASLERISPVASADDPHNWAPSALSDAFLTQPSGTPGKENGALLPGLAPTILDVTPAAKVVSPGEKLQVSAQVGESAERIELLYSVISSGQAGEEVAVNPKSRQGQRYVFEIPASESNRIVRYRIKVSDGAGNKRFSPHPNELRPAFSTLVIDDVSVGALPVMDFIGTTKEVAAGFEAYRTSHARARSFGRGRFGPPPEISRDEQRRREAFDRLRNAPVKKIWADLTLVKERPVSELVPLARGFNEANRAIETLQLELMRASNVPSFLGELESSLRKVYSELEEKCARVLADSELEPVRALVREPNSEGNATRGRRPADIVRVFFNVEDSWFRSVVQRPAQAESVSELFSIHQGALATRRALLEKVENGGGFDFRELLGEAREGRSSMDEKVLALLEPESQRRENPERVGRGRPGGDRGFRGRPGFGRPTQAVNVPPQGKAALIYRDPEEGGIQFFDFINIISRKSGYKVRLQKDEPLNGMTTLNVLYERGDASTINEAMAYPVYRDVGNATVGSGLVRLLMNGKVAGYHLWFEQPNGNFFRRNGIDADGNLYKVIWQNSNRPSAFTPESEMPERGDIASRYEKMSHPHEGYADLVGLVEALEKAQGDDAATWRVIEQHFDVDQVINYYAVNLLLSHWDGFFNNYFLYHDSKGSGKWMLFPWDQDSTWSLRGGSPDSLSRMPLNFGGEGARPPGAEESPRSEGRRSRFGGFGGFGRGGFGWWRDGDMISKPLIGNPTFFARYKARLRKLVQETFTPDSLEPKLEWLNSAVRSEALLRAQTHGGDENSAGREFDEVVSTLSEHLEKRRAFLLSELSQ